MATTEEFSWSRTSAPMAGSRYDDIWFVGPQEGWAINSDGKILKTEDGGATWKVQFQPGINGDAAVYLRCITFGNPQVGWAGTLTPPYLMYHTSDGGAHWAQVENLPPQGPVKVCGLYAVDATTIYASGTNNPADGAAMLKTTDGGANWMAWDMSRWASSLIDVYFTDANNGWVVGGYANDPNPSYNNVQPIILRTEDGGATWENRIADLSSTFPLGTWGWKIQFLDDQLGFVSLENFEEAFILKTTDGGQSWSRIDIPGNANLEGVGFIDEANGWVGGWGDATFQAGTSSVTSDSGVQWQNANEIGRFINRFRFIGKPLAVGYASGRFVYKYDRSVASVPENEPAVMRFLASDVLEEHEGDVPVEFVLPEKASRATIHIWDRFGNSVCKLLDEQNPASGSRTEIWNRRDDSKSVLNPGIYIYRLTVDGEGESRVIALR